MAEPKNLNLLVVEDDLEDEQLLCEALIEIEENRQWCNWRGANIVQVDQLSDALDCLRRERFDAVLLNLSLPDSPALLDTFLEANIYARGAPIIVLADQEDENLANRLLREGAEDVVLKPELECGPLARSVRYAIERRRRKQDGGPSSLAGGATSVLNGQNFASIAFHYARLAFSRQIELHLATLDIRDLPEGTPEDREARELFLMRAADVLHDAMPAPALVGRIGKYRFGIILAGMTTDDAELLAGRAADDIEEVFHGLVPAKVGFSVIQFNGEQSVEALLNHDDATEASCNVKPLCWQIENRTGCHL